MVTGFAPDRRRLLRTVGSGVAGLTGLTTVAAAVSNDEPAASLVFEDQTSDGTSVVVAEASIEVDGFVAARSDETGTIAWVEIEAGETVEDLELEFDEPIDGYDELELAVSVVDGETGDGLVRETATVVFDDTVEIVSGLEETLVDADPDAGFNYPYYLYAPDRVTDGDPTPVVVEPVNTGMTVDDLDPHLDRGESTIESGIARTISEELGAPLLVPVFPRPEREPVDWTHYVHALDRETIGIEDGPLERVDLQLLAMVEDARELLDDEGYETAAGIMLNGFSASGNFVERFTVLHPEEVVSVTAGGLNGMVTLPLEEYEGVELPYHVGIADVEELTGSPVDLEAFDAVDQFLYMGGVDDNDTIPYDDAWTEESLRETALEVYGEDMILDRFPTCQEAFEEAGVDAQFKIYPDEGHSPRAAEADVLEFHRRSLAGEDTSDLGEDVRETAEEIGPPIGIEASTTEPDEGKAVEFTATVDEERIEEPLVYAWDFDDGETAAEESVTHAFDEPGKYTITVTVVDDEGSLDETELVVTVGEGTDGDSEDGTDGDGEEDEADDEAEGTDGDGDGEDETDGDGEDGTDDEAEGTDGDDEEEDTDDDGEEDETDEDDGQTDDDESSDDDGAADGDQTGTDDDQTSTDDGDDEGDADGESDADGDDRADAGSDDTDGIPGPGLVGTLASIGGASYLLRRRFGDERSDEVRE